MSKPAVHHMHEDAYMCVMKGLTELDLRGSAVPSTLVLTGDHAFPLATSSKGQILMAASMCHKGRIVVLGHESYLTACPSLVENAVTWLGGAHSKKPVSVGVQRKYSNVAKNLSTPHFLPKVVGSLSDSPDVDVYVTDAYIEDEKPKDLVKFLKAGGGLLMAGQAWSWAKGHPKQATLINFKGNKVSGAAGIHFCCIQGDVECLPVSPKIPTSWMTGVIDEDFVKDLEFLLRGVSQFEFQGGALFSEILVHGSLAFPIGITDDGGTFLAGAYYGQGRVIVISHEGFIGSKNIMQFWKNALQWLDEDRNGVVGVAHDKAFKHLKTSGLKCENTKFRKDLSVYICTAYSAKEADEILEFVEEGGGLLIGGHAWYWAQTHPGQNPLTDFPGNKILNKMGLSLLETSIKGALFKAPMPSHVFKDMYHFRHLLHRFAGYVNRGDKLTKEEEKHLKKLSKDCASYLKMNAHGCCFYTQLLSSLTDILVMSGMPQVCESYPVKNPKDHLLLNVGTELYKVSPDPDTLLPHLIKNNPVMPVLWNHKITITVNTANMPEWVSTGLYLSPGMKTYMAIPAELVGKDWKVQVGCQTDVLDHDKLLRPPCVHQRFSINKEMIQVWNLWGGLIYLVAPKNTQVDGAEVIVQMAVPAPYYKAGETTLSEWSYLRTAPAPWAELEFDNIILTVPTDVVKDLERPDELAEHWNIMMNAIADLAARPHKFKRKERVVTDVQISHGWMHAGYPIMMHKATAPHLVSVEHAKKNGLWGPIHELGHNQQRACWEFPPHTTEGTCNLWSVYVHETVLGISRGKAHPNMTKECREKRTKELR
uniref:TRPM8 channel-associated factor-like protein n=1 Tax=Cynoglossus semilaevis TaxID=244447 RepID=A0A6B7GST2_CYNSE|nr:TRPM8 channel-associated factor-like protein [Cynoglossus semilaevis]